MKKNISIVLISFVLGLFLFNSCDKIDAVDGSYAKPVYTEKMNFVEFYNDAAQSFSEQYTQFNTKVEAKGSMISMVVLNGDATVLGNTFAAAELSSKLDLEQGTALMVLNRTKESGQMGVKEDNWASVLDRATDKGKVNLKIDGQYKGKTFEGTFNVNATSHISKTIKVSSYIVVDKISINDVEIHNLLFEDSLNMLLANSLEEGKNYSLDFNYSIKNYNVNYDYNLIVCVEEAETGKVLQTQMIELKEDNGSEELIFYDKQKVFIEDFTGHKCGNCPKGHRALKEIMASNGDQVVGMAIHAGYFAEPQEGSEFSADFRTHAGTSIADYFGLISPPKGLINRVGEEGAKLKPVAEWETLVADLLEQTPKVGIALRVGVSSNTISAKVAVKAFENVSEQCKVQLFVIENHIVAPQTDYSQTPSEIEEYDHEHMLRASMNGDWGENLNEGEFSQEQIITKSYTLNKKEDWNDRNLAVIAIVYDDVTKEILQVEEVEL